MARMTLLECAVCLHPVTITGSTASAVHAACGPVSERLCDTLTWVSWTPNNRVRSASQHLQLCTHVCKAAQERQGRSIGLRHAVQTSPSIRQQIEHTRDLVQGATYATKLVQEAVGQYE